MSGSEVLKKEKERMVALMTEQSLSAVPEVACKARFALAAGIPFQVALNDERLRAAPRGGEGQAEVFAAAITAIANMAAILTQHYMMSTGQSLHQSASVMGDAISAETSRIFSRWRETGDMPLPVRFDQDGKEVPFDALAVMKGGAA